MKTQTTTQLIALMEQNKFNPSDYTIEINDKEEILKGLEVLEAMVATNKTYSLKVVRGIPS